MPNSAAAALCHPQISAPCFHSQLVLSYPIPYEVFNKPLTLCISPFLLLLHTEYTFSCRQTVILLSLPPSRSSDFGAKPFSSSAFPDAACLPDFWPLSFWLSPNASWSPPVNVVVGLSLCGVGNAHVMWSRGLSYPGIYFYYSHVKLFTHAPFVSHNLPLLLSAFTCHPFGSIPPQVKTSEI